MQLPLNRTLGGRLQSRAAAGFWMGALAIPSVLLAMAISVSSLAVHMDGNFLRVSAPQMQFLAGKPMDRLHDGATVGYIAQLSVSTDRNSTVYARSVARFAFSYDIWEERFSVTRFSPVDMMQPVQTVSHLSLQAAQAWCLNNVGIGSAQLPEGRPFWVRLDVRAEEPHDTTGIIGEPGINITRLIEIFSRPPRTAQPRWTLDAGPVMIADLKRVGEHFAADPGTGAGE